MRSEPHHFHNPHYARNVKNRLLLAAIVLIVVAVATTALLWPHSSGPSTTTTSAAHTLKFKPYAWPSTVKAYSVKAVEDTSPIKFGTELTAAQMKGTRQPYYPFATSYLGKIGFALGYFGQSEYPITTSDGGVSWTIAGPYFVLAHTLYGNFGANVIETFSASVAVAYGYQAVYDTPDGGRHWYVTDFPSAVVGANMNPAMEEYAIPNFAYGALDYVAAKGTLTVTVTQSAWQAIGGLSTHVISTAQYASVDGGAVWRLVHSPTSPPMPETATSAPPTCLRSQLRVAFGGGIGGLGHEDSLIQVTNVSGKACSLAGYPRVTGVFASGVQRIFKETLNGYMGGINYNPLKKVKLPVVTLRARHGVASSIEESVHLLTCPSFISFSVSLPHVTGGTYSFHLHSPDPHCYEPEVHPFVPGSTGSLNEVG